MPPVQLSYRGLGEAVIAVSYGPALTLGGFYLQAGRLSLGCLLASMLPALLILALALANEVPDYYGDRLVGKRNVIVRVGRRGAACIYAVVTALCFGLVAGGLFAGWFPPLLWLALLFVPLAIGNGFLALRDCERPARFLRVIRGTIFMYVLVNAVAISSYVAR
jgi:1,4-dihydroxy-2-naphthoate octaprenyltransferase